MLSYLQVLMCMKSFAMHNSFRIGLHNSVPASVYMSIMK